MHPRNFYFLTKARAVKFRIGEMIVYPYSLRLYFFTFLINKLRLGGIRFRSKYDATPYPHYAYGMINAALQAKELGLSSISAIEFGGVAGGNGLVEMEKISAEIENELGVSIEVYGFDGGLGLPSTSDFRDQIYFGHQVIFVMDEKKVASKIENWTARFRRCFSNSP